MKIMTHWELSISSAIVIIDIPPYGRVKPGDDKKTAFTQLNMLIDDLYEQVDCASQEGFQAM